MTSSPPAVVVCTPRLRLREFALTDAKFIVELVNDADWLRFIGDKGVRNADDARRYLLDGPLASYARNGFGLWCVEELSSDERIGMCGLIRRDTLPDVDVGFAFLARHRGRGFAREATAAALEHGRSQLGLARIARIVAITALENLRSQRVLEACGLRFERSVQLATDAAPVALFALG